MSKVHGNWEYFFGFFFLLFGSTLNDRKILIDAAFPRTFFFSAVWPAGRICSRSAYAILRQPGMQICEWTNEPKRQRQREKGPIDAQNGIIQRPTSDPTMTFGVFEITNVLRSFHKIKWQFELLRGIWFSGDYPFRPFKLRYPWAVEHTPFVSLVQSSDVFHSHFDCVSIISDFELWTRRDWLIGYNNNNNNEINK